MKKSYNPFKMWGSYVGIITYLISQTGTIINILVDNPRWNTSFNALCPSSGTCIEFPEIFVYIILSFLVGWGIHSLFRKLSKSKKRRK